MDVKGSLGQVRTWLWLALGGSMLTVFKYTLENSDPPPNGFLSCLACLVLLLTHSPQRLSPYGLS